jgi:5-methylcytosine-specific restriction endonuclease McrA
MQRGVKPCKYCGGYSHLSWKCPQKAIKERARVQRLKKGKVGKQWEKTRETWFKRNPQDYYTCYLQISPSCERVMLKERTTLDHIKSRSRHPELRFVLSNLAPSCWPCNLNKGSKDLEDILWQEPGQAG